MAPQMAWPIDYDDKGDVENKEHSLHPTTSYYDDKSPRDSYPPSDSLAVSFKHDLQRGLKSRQIAMV